MVKLDVATQKPQDEDDGDDDELENSPSPELYKKSSVKRASSVKVSKVEETKLELADAEDKKYEEALEE